MLELLGWFFLVLLALDVVAWTFVLTVAGLCRLVKRFFLALIPYRENPTL
jgi:hypothetical protein